MNAFPVYFLLWVLSFIYINCGKPQARYLETNSSEIVSQKPDSGQSGGIAESQYHGKVIHVVVALCDNVNQGIVPVPARLGNGEDLQNNLYWGAAFGVKAFFNRKDSDWQLVSSLIRQNQIILERCIFKHKKHNCYLIADAYRGAEINQCISDFFTYAAGNQQENIIAQKSSINIGGNANLLVYIGHDGLMDFNLNVYPKGQPDNWREAIMLCCFSKRFFAAPLRSTGARPLLWTTGLMAPEAYILKAALDGWLLGENKEQIRHRAASSYHQYQHCGLTSALNLFASGW